MAQLVHPDARPERGSQRPSRDQEPVFLEHHPTLAGKVAGDLANWKTQALADQLSSIMESETVLDPASKMAVDYYLSMAPRFRAIR